MAGEVARPRSRRLTVVPRKVAGHGETAVWGRSRRGPARKAAPATGQKSRAQKVGEVGGPAALQVDLPPPGEPLRMLPIRGFEEAPGAASVTGPKGEIRNQRGERPQEAISVLCTDPEPRVMQVYEVNSIEKNLFLSENGDSAPQANNME
ncbi:hypothetical protein ACSS6W_001614 [Trichoderma asperelloides]